MIKITECSLSCEVQIQVYVCILCISRPLFIYIPVHVSVYTYKWVLSCTVYKGIQLLVIETEY